jgi:alkanesulfonate monooxygenase SsuD/methylene tetrahydromethanopterin reductase-like flavin-dependent oxidoreductase (luciferase family)
MYEIKGRTGKPLRIGTSVDRVGAALSRSVEMGQRLEQAGFDFLTTGDNCAETFALTGAIAQATSSIRMVSCIAVWSRSPATMAHAANSLANLSNGRFDLGIGPAPRNWIMDWHGMEYDPVLPRMREYLRAVRACLAATPDNPTDLDGKYYPTHGYGGWGLAVPKPVALQLAATRPKMTALAAEVCDGVQLNLVPPLQWVQEQVPQYLAEGRKAAGRTDPFEFSVDIVRCIGIHQDRSVAYDLCRTQLAFYFAIPYFRILLEPYGFAPELDAGEAALRSGDKKAQIAAVSDRLVDAVGIAGTPDEVYRKIEAYAPHVDSINFTGGTNLPPEVADSHVERILAAFSRG